MVLAGITVAVIGENGLFGGDPTVALNLPIGKQVFLNLSMGLIGYFIYAVFASGLTAAYVCLLYTSPSPRDQRGSRMPSSA